MTSRLRTRLKEALNNLKILNEELKDDLQRPEYHFIAPAMWMNDPNGPLIYYNEYHIFYQFNPYNDQWGNIHWGHAKSKDLINWEHLPIAIAPSIEDGEEHCFSGSCIIHNGKPYILYTSIGPERPPLKGAEQWLAIGEKDLTLWEKFDNNPIMKNDINMDQNILDWRDPFVWQSDDSYYAILGGHLENPTRPLIVLYKSSDLINWQYLNPLIIESKSKGRNWECPNLFPLQDKHVLFVSTHKQVIYNIGEFKENKFIPMKWQIFDYGKCYYATNGLVDKKNNRIIIWGWIKGGGDIKGWNGCLSLPREIYLNTNNDQKLIIKPITELKRLRSSYNEFKNINLNSNGEFLIKTPVSVRLELKIKISHLETDYFALNLYNTNNIKAKASIGYDLEKKDFWAGKEKLKFKQNPFHDEKMLHIFIDHSVQETYINNSYVISSRISLEQKPLKLILKIKEGSLKIDYIKVWELKKIKNKMKF